MHTYASVAEFKNFLRDNGAADLGSGNDGMYLSRLEAASRRVDEFCNRSKFGTGFGPRIGTNKYDGDGTAELWLNDDLDSATPTLTTRSQTAGSTSTPVVETDFYVATAEGYSGPPWRRLILHGMGTPTVFGVGFRTTDVLSTWAGPGWGTVVADATVASGLTATTNQLVFQTSVSPDLSPGQTLLIGTEALYLAGLAGTTATVKARGANGTTPAVHADSSPISVYTYHPSVVDATIQVALRRLRSRDAGLTGAYGGGDVPSSQQQDSEWKLLWGTVGDLRIPVA